MTIERLIGVLQSYCYQTQVTKKNVGYFGSVISIKANRNKQKPQDFSKSAPKILYYTNLSRV